MGEASNYVERNEGWIRFWKIKVPDRVKLTTWRLYRNGLPVACSLHKRGCITMLGCQFCGFKEEDTTHVFFDCWWSKSFWKKLDVLWPDSGAASSTGDRLWHAFRSSNLDALKRIVIGIWVIWWNRNLAVHEKALWSLDHCYSNVINLKLQFDTRAFVGSGASVVHTNQGIDMISVLCDGSWLSVDKRGGFGCVAWKGKSLVGCSAGVVPVCSSAIATEIQGIVAGLLLAEALNARHAQIMSDSSEAIWALQSGGGVPDDCAQLAMLGLNVFERNPYWRLVLIPREVNGLADFLAKKANSRSWILALVVLLGLGVLCSCGSCCWPLARVFP